MEHPLLPHITPLSIASTGSNSEATEESNISRIDMDPFAHNDRSLDVALYGIFVGIMAILVGTSVQMTKSTQENKIHMAFCLATLVMNFVTLLSVFSQKDDIHHKGLKTIIFKVIFIFTGILSPYLAFCLLLPEWFTWFGFVIICIIVTIIKGHNIMKFIITWPYQKLAITIKYVIAKFSVLFLRDQLSNVVAV
ncbi:hypothetical protein L1987_58851 [Smallanthus sonchifolius]|uniref:Uncharacterized protein n=1 Tax=Smallanthus sonchifolius TaxID=185202 RepID=A0ACB9D3N6_9ASTR|nr:hypothetical protein L1987_58851 [Smallanthus sonchifolius]